VRKLWITVPKEIGMAVRISETTGCREVATIFPGKVEI